MLSLSLVLIVGVARLSINCWDIILLWCEFFCPLVRSLATKQVFCPSGWGNSYVLFHCWTLLKARLRRNLVFSLLKRPRPSLGVLNKQVQCLDRAAMIVSAKCWNHALPLKVTKQTKAALLVRTTWIKYVPSGSAATKYSIGFLFLFVGKCRNDVSLFALSFLFNDFIVSRDCSLPASALFLFPVFVFVQKKKV